MTFNSIQIEKTQRFELILQLVDFFNAQLRKIKSMEGSSNEEIVYKQIVLQYNLIVKQDLESIYLLYKNNQMFTPHFILRNMLEHLITLAYIEKDKFRRAKQYALSGNVGHRKIINWSIQNKIFGLYKPLKSQLKRIEKEYSKNKPHLKNWSEKIWERAKNAGLEEMYVGYRFLSILSHPDSNNSTYFFKNGNGKTVFNDFNEDTSISNMTVALAMASFFIIKLNEEFGLSIDKKYSKLLEQIGNLTPSQPDVK